MLNILNKLITLAMFLASAWCFHAATTIVFASSFLNVGLFIVAIFFLLQGCGRLDKAYGYGKYSKDKDDKPDDESKT